MKARDFDIRHPHTCKCGNTYFRFNILQRMCVKCLAEKGKQIQFKEKKQKLKKQKANTPAKLKKKLWTLVSLFVRQSAADHRGMAACYTCGAVDEWKYMDAGHAIGGRTGAV